MLIKPGPPFNFVYICGFVDLPRRIAASSQLILNQYQHHKDVAVIHFPCSETEAVLELLYASHPLFMQYV